MKAIFFVDASGSVSGESLYHNVIRKIFNKYFNVGDIIYTWGSSYKKLSENEFRTCNNNKSGELGGTASQLIADIINIAKNSGIEHLIIFTDGRVDGDSIDEDESDKKMKIIIFISNMFLLILLVLEEIDLLAHPIVEEIQMLLIFILMRIIQKN